MSRLRRFLHLERPRAAGGEARDAATSAAGRFEGVLRPGRHPRAPSASGAGLGRFGPDPDPRIELVEADAAARPFTRCMRCGMDHGVFATECEGCGASLDTEAQRAFNEQLWARRREEAAREEAANAGRRALAARAESSLSASRRAMAEELARLATEGLGGGWGLPGEGKIERTLRRLLRLLGG